MPLERDEQGRIKPGSGGRQRGALNRSTRFKNAIFDILENRNQELSKANIVEIAKLGAKFVPREHSISGDMKHTGFIETMILKAAALKAEQEGEDGDEDTNED